MTRAEAVRMIVSICADHEVSDAIIAALTAAPEKPRVDVRKVWKCWPVEYGVPDYDDLKRAIINAGLEVME